LISNLLLNGLQHSGRGTQMDISVHRNGGWVDLVISDQGQGIDSAALPHVFERFYRGDPSRNRNTGGTGLGLSICKAIVDAARGEIRLSSEQGAGTSVLVRLPVSESVSPILSEGYVSSAVLPSA
jgi:signal transduction histidine kinase